MLNEISLVFHRGSKIGYHFIMKEWSNQSEGTFEWLGEKTEKYKTFSVPIKKEIKKNDKDGNEDNTTISYKIKFIDTARLIASPLSNLVDSLADKNRKIKCKDCNW